MDDGWGKGSKGCRPIDPEWVIIYNLVVNDTPKWGVYMDDENNEPIVYSTHYLAEVAAKQLKNVLSHTGVKCECYIVRAVGDGIFRPDVK